MSTTIMTNDKAAGGGIVKLLNLMRLASPALPVGAFAYSQGLESAIDEGVVTDAESAGKWIKEVFEQSFSYLDIPVMKRLHQAWCNQDNQGVLYWNQFLLASRETSELLKEEQQIGAAMKRLLNSLNIVQPDIWQEDKPGYCCQFALAGCAWGIQSSELTSAFAYGWVENQVSVATKLVPIGQSDAQRILESLFVTISDAIELDLLDDELGQSMPGLAILSSWHEKQTTRLFRS
jgi:urease accessory protein|tara:strand:+ start:326 stop:1027 length:702 start_codon:yes stop_codon:yes gene_type:complete